MSNVYHQLSSSNFSQDWSNTGLITTANDWSLVPSIIGFRGDTLSNNTSTDPQNVTGTSDVINVIANQTNPNTLTTGGIAEFEIADPTVALQGSGTADAPYLAIYLDATGRESVTLSFNARDIDGSGDNSVQKIAVQYRIGDSGTWINLPAGAIADASTGPNLATLVTAVSVTLPATVNGQSQVQVRIITNDAAGSDEWIGIDDILVTSQPAAVEPTFPGQLAIADATIAEGDSGTAELTFTVTRTAGDDGPVSATWTASFPGSADAADLAAGTPLAGTVTFADGQTSATITIPVAGDTTFEPDETFIVTLSAPTGGATLSDAAATGTITNDDAAPPPPPVNVWINEIHYDNSGSDVGEAVEIAGLAGTNLTGWSLVLYNGNGGLSYSTRPLSGIIADQSNGFGTVSISVSGIQNGNDDGTQPDGIALVDASGRVVQFLSYEGSFTASNGPAAGLTSTDIGVSENPAPGAGLSMQLVGTGSSYGDFTWVAGADDSFGGVNAGQAFLSGTDQGQISVGNAQVVEGNAGETALVFTVSRAGGFASGATVSFTIGFGTAGTDDVAPGTPLSGTLTFAAGVFSQTITIPVVGDIVAEPNEWLFVELANPTGNAVIADSTGIGTILNDDPVALTIMEIQGEGHFSAYQGQIAITSGTVTAVAANGFYIQDALGDGNARTSDGVFVFTRTAPTVAVGDGVRVTGRVTEFGSDLPVTEIDLTGNASFGAMVTSSGNVLPGAVLVGDGGLIPPTESIDSDAFAVFNPETDGADFWESLEGMRVAINAPQVVANSNSSFDETYVVASSGNDATGLNSSGGITISPGDFNPEMIQLDGALIRSAGYNATHSVGDELATVIGVVNFSFAHYELLLTEVPTTTLDVTLQPETVMFTGDANYMTVATMNVENLDPSDGRYDAIARQIDENLGLPDVIAVQEMQDDDGAANTSVTSAAQNAQNLIDAIFAQSGVLYAYVEIAPDDDSSGGEQGGNIRVGYFYRVDRVDLLEGSVQVIDDSSFDGSRLPLVATWSFQGTEVTTINVHFTSRIGSDPLYGTTQPPVNAGDDRRIDQADAVGDWINAQLATDPAFNAMVLGDFNAFYFEEALTQLTGLVNLQQSLLPEAERYSYVFEGNGQLLDNILVTGGLFGGAGVDGVHVNAYLGAAALSDHDPQVARLLLGTRPSDIVISNDNVAENAPAGTQVGIVSSTDAPGDRLTYALVDNAGGRFAINSTTGALLTMMALDYEALANFSVTVRVTDGAGQSSDQLLAISVTNVNEAPVAAGDSLAILEDATSANLWSQLLGNDSDPDAGDSLSISSVDGSGTLGSLLLDSTTQSLRYIADHDSFDALTPGATATDTFRYTVTDASGLTSTASVTVTITGIDDGETLRGSNGRDTLTATAGEDRLYGENGDDRLFGGAGHDLLDGGRGNDLLDGGTGNDLLIGGRGDDLLSGGLGNDSFAFGLASGNDVILDFDALRDSVRLDEGQTVSQSRTADLNGDGLADLWLELSGGGTVALYGIDSIDDVRFEAGSSSSAARGAGWQDSLATFGGAEQHHHFAAPFAHGLDEATLALQPIA